MKRSLVFILPLFVSAFMACTGSGSKQKTATPQEKVDATHQQTVVHRPVLPDTTSTVKGYETHKYLIPVESEGVYTVTTSSPNTGLIFVIQDANGNNVTQETSEWKGELQKGEYTLIVGLTRNAARKNLNNEVKYSVKVKRD